VDAIPVPNSSDAVHYVFDRNCKGKLSLDDPAMRHIDPILMKMNGTTLVKLFGAEAAQITVGHVLQMRSG
jgi:hypothetical protein